MALMQKCCCCGVRGGSIASAIYSLVIAILGLVNYGYSLMNIKLLKENLYDLKYKNPEVFSDLDVDMYVCAMKAQYIFACIFLFLLLISSIMVIVAINKDTKELLVPFLASRVLGFVWYAFTAILTGCYVSKIGTDVAGFAILVVLILLIPFFISDLVCFLCVLSQYQEYRDGRGRQCDQIGTTVIVQQTVPIGAGGFAYSQMQNDAPPAYGPPPTTKVV